MHKRKRWPKKVSYGTRSNKLSVAFGLRLLLSRAMTGSRRYLDVSMEGKPLNT